jgi:hypothetical protein
MSAYLPRWSISVAGSPQGRSRWKWVCERLRDAVLTCSSWGSSWSQCASDRDETGAAFANSRLAMCQLSSWLSISLLAMPLREATHREGHSQCWLAAAQKMGSEGGRRAIPHCAECVERRGKPDMIREGRGAFPPCRTVVQ